MAVIELTELKPAVTTADLRRRARARRKKKPEAAAKAKAG
jgi:hypothetical protein